MASQAERREHQIRNIIDRKAKNPLIEKAARKLYSLTHGEDRPLLVLEDTTELFSDAAELESVTPEKND